MKLKRENISILLDLNLNKTYSCKYNNTKFKLAVGIYLENLDNFRLNYLINLSIISNIFRFRSSPLGSQNIQD